jgi:hypothetical protein
LAKEAMMRRWSVLSAALAFGLCGCTADTADTEGFSQTSTAPLAAEAAREVGAEEEATPADDRPTPTVLDIASFVRERIGRRADALLPKTVTCRDPVAGTWVSREHFSKFGDWYRFELRIRRQSGDRIAGEIVSRSWSGEPTDLQPQRCRPGARDAGEFDWTVHMTATGTFSSEEIAFDGGELKVEANGCGEPMTVDGYNPDRFTGHLLEDGLHLVAFNNDGGRARNEMHLFRRVACK